MYNSTFCKHHVRVLCLHDFPPFGKTRASIPRRMTRRRTLSIPNHIRPTSIARNNGRKTAHAAFRISLHPCSLARERRFSRRNFTLASYIMALPRRIRKAVGFNLWDRSALVMTTVLASKFRDAAAEFRFAEILIGKACDGYNRQLEIRYASLIKYRGTMLPWSKSSPNQDSFSSVPTGRPSFLFFYDFFNQIHVVQSSYECLSSEIGKIPIFRLSADEYEISVDHCVRRNNDDASVSIPQFHPQFSAASMVSVIRSAFPIPEPLRADAA